MAVSIVAGVILEIAAPARARRAASSWAEAEREEWVAAIEEATAGLGDDVVELPAGDVVEEDDERA